MSKQENQFRIGGVYHNGNGDGPWKIVAGPVADVVCLEHADDGGQLSSCWCLTDGWWEGSDHADSGMHLIPGELTQTPSGWMALGAEKQEPRYSGFTCPECGSHYFGTSMWKGMNGHCHGDQHTGNGCKFTWDRNDAAEEARCIYQQSPEEWAASYVKPELREVEPTSADLNAAMVLRDGPAKPKPVIFGIYYAAGCAPSTAKPNPFAAFRYPDCDSGPSDHLNASRHQMAGMSKS